MARGAEAGIMIADDGRITNNRISPGTLSVEVEVKMNPS